MGATPTHVAKEDGVTSECCDSLGSFSECDGSQRQEQVTHEKASGQGRCCGKKEWLFRRCMQHEKTINGGLGLEIYIHDWNVTMDTGGKKQSDNSEKGA